MLRVAIYSRKSVETDTGESIKNQIAICKQYFKRQNEECKFEIFEDEGFSGSNINRPSFQRMMELAKIRQFDVIAVYKIDRIARNIVDFVNVYDELDKLNIKLISITEGFDPSTPVGKMMMMLLASFAEMERMNIAQRVKDNMKELAKMGHWSGGTPPKGYKANRIKENSKKITHLELIEDDAKDIKEIFEQYALGLSMYKISKSFKAKGKNYPNKTISNILINPTYLKATNESVKYLESQGYTVYGEPNNCGFLPYNRRPKSNGKKTWNNIDKFVSISIHKPIIDLELWVRVQEKLKEKTIAPHPHESSYSFLSGGLIRCKCGGHMLLKPGAPRKKVPQKYYFVCANKWNGIGCPSKHLRVDYAEDDFLSFLEKFLDKNYLKEYLNQSNDIKGIDQEIKSINKKIKSNDILINNLIDKLALMSNDASKLLMKKIEDLTQNNNSLKEYLLKSQREKLLNDLNKNNIDVIYDTIKKILNTSNNDLRRIYIKNLVKEIIYDYDTNSLNIIISKLGVI
ncbi:recombinase family protein [Clostridium coskatii]|uniref:DNA-invertase hin n=1 Tax=Clostridium coskatii TaxID=1705578 RepID=A0A162LCE8_9CLOT|nr:recombinase family protein [Clostridium coskatii]OAA94112.1 DNA-invertase hin [Clostridium coskatii]OBR96674.1 DNA-invertase hin [Clostridium coskatii]